MAAALLTEKFSRLFKKFLPLAGIILLGYILSRIDMRSSSAIVAASNKSYLLACAFIGPAIVLIMALRWQVILRSIGIRYAFVASMRCLVKGTIWGEVTPGRIGELFRVKMAASQTGASIGKLFFSVVIDRIYDLIVLAVFSVAAAVLLITDYADINLPIMVLIFVPAGCGALVMMVMNEKNSHRFMNYIITLLFPERLRQRAGIQLSEFFEGLRSMNKGAHAECFFLSLAIWLLKLITVYILVCALRLQVPFLFSLATGSLAVAVSLLPVSISGLGTREAVFIYLLSLQGISAEQAVALSVLFFLFGIGSVVVPALFVYASELVNQFHSSNSRKKRESV